MLRQGAGGAGGLGACSPLQEGQLQVHATIFLQNTSRLIFNNQLITRLKSLNALFFISITVKMLSYFLHKRSYKDAFYKVINLKSRDMKWHFLINQSRFNSTENTT
jgi:hypothetical protein